MFKLNKIYESKDENFKGFYILTISDKVNFDFDSKFYEIIFSDDVFFIDEPNYSAFDLIHRGETIYRKISLAKGREILKERGCIDEKIN